MSITAMSTTDMSTTARKTGPLVAAGIALMALAGGGAALADEDALTLDMTPQTARYWRFLSDRVMGGVSDGRVDFVTLDGRPAARMTGDVSTANNGGFIQFRAGLDMRGLPDAGADLAGITISARGNDQTYFIHLRTNDTRRPWHYYSAAFTVDQQWQTFTLPFSDFKHSAGLAPLTPPPDQLTSIGIVAYGRDHAADVAVSSIAFY